MYFCKRTYPLAPLPYRTWWQPAERIKLNTSSGQWGSERQQHGAILLPASPCPIQYSGWTCSLEPGIPNPMQLTLQWSVVASRQQISLSFSDPFKVCEVQKQQQEGLQGSSSRTTTQDMIKWENSAGQAKSSLGWKKSLTWIHGRKVHQGLSGRKAGPLVSQVANQWSSDNALWCPRHKLFPGPHSRLLLETTDRDEQTQSPWSFSWLKAELFSQSYHWACHSMQQAARDTPSWGLKFRDIRIISLWGWHHPQFYSHRRIAESKANSKWRLELLQYLSLIKMTCLKSISPELQAAPSRAQCFSYRSIWSQTCFAKMVADAMCCPSHGWGDLSSIMPKGRGRGKHTMESPAAVETSSKMRGFSLFHTHWQQTNDLPIRRAGQAWKMTSHQHTCLHHNGKLENILILKKTLCSARGCKDLKVRKP